MGVCLVMTEEERETMTRCMNSPYSPSLTAVLTSMAIPSPEKTGLCWPGQTPKLRMSPNTSLQENSGAVHSSMVDRLWFLANKVMERVVVLAQDTEVR